MTTATSFTAESAALPTTRQDDLSDAYMDGGPAPLWPFFQGLGNAKAMNESALINAISWSGDVSIAPGQAANNFDITVGAINAVCLYNGTIYKVFSSSGATVTEAKVEGGGGTLGAAAAWWYLYCYNNGGTLDYEVSTTAPNANRVAKSGDATRRFLCSFKTLSTGQPIPMRKAGNLCLYRVSGLPSALSADVRALNAGTSVGSFATVALATWLPPHARVARLRAVLKATSGIAAQAYAFVQTNGDSGNGYETIYGSATSGEFGGASFDVETDGSRQVQYSSSEANTELSLYVHGWYE
jgi:hypothetical protein